MELKNILFFRDIKELRTWFLRHHKTEKELWIGFYKKGSGKEGVTYPESVDTALCFGWIDGIRKSLDDVSYTNRFTPRKPNSNWSLININKVKKLKKSGLMEPAGLAVYEKRRKDKSGIYSFEKEIIILPDEYEKMFRINKKAWEFFTSQVPSYKKPAIHWVMSAKQELTRQKRLGILISNSSKKEKIPILRR
jgi:uncharacterized protein YdeI (YjbR/CyaY-like superfamily)